MATIPNSHSDSGQLFIIQLRPRHCHYLHILDIYAIKYESTYLCVTSHGYCTLEYNVLEIIRRKVIGHQTKLLRHAYCDAGVGDFHFVKL